MAGTLNVERFQLLALLALGAVSGCGSASVAAPAFSPGSTAARAMELYDQNADAKLDAQEIDRATGLKVALPQIDTSGDGTITQDELEARIRHYDSQQLGGLGVTCRVLLDGQPLAGATVRLVPLEFLNETIQPASGVTDMGGTTTLKADGSQVGVHCGLYRVEISLKDSGGNEQVPAIYNAQSELGQEVSSDTPGLERGITYVLTRS
jgi:hypothetical protein